MNITLEQLKTGRFQEFELRKKSRRLSGYSLFLSFFFLNWKSKSKEKQLRELGGHRHDQPIEDLDSDYESVDSLSIDHRDVIRHATSQWKLFSLNRRNCWGIRADRLNLEPVLGRFESVPSFLDGETLCECITMEWSNTCKVLRSAITREPCRNMYQKNYAMSFPCLKTKVGTQSFRRAHISPIVHLCVFGKDYTKLRDHEIIQKRIIMQSSTFHR